MIGQTLSHFKITAKLGEGGMGEVYRAEDTKLGREVAIKVLPPAFTEDPGRLARFEREARLLASLNHPNIAAIHQVEEVGDQRLLVMELVEGEDLAHRLERGPMELDDALRVALQIAEALESAHDRGVVHRDLKPANVKITPAGQAKVLDFGLAKAMEAPGGGPEGANLSLSPTLTAGMTGEGVLLGTAAYMSPEQAKGMESDRRADVWAFGVLVWEMLSGRRLFAGDSVSDTLAAVLRDQIDPGTLPPDTPATLQALLARCLDRDPRSRLRDIGEARVALGALVSGQDTTTLIGSTVIPATEPAVTPPSSKLPWAVAGLALALASIGFLWNPGNEAGPVEEAATPTLRFAVEMPNSGNTRQGDGVAIAISPDGESIVTRGGAGTDDMLYLRSLSDFQARPIDGTANGRMPLFSPDGRWIAFLEGTNILKVRSNGGASVLIGPFHALPDGIDWAEDNFIYSGFQGGLRRIFADGGKSETLTSPDLDKYQISQPTAIRGTRTLLCNTSTAPGRTGRLLAIDLDTLEVKDLDMAGTNPRYVQSGHVVFAQGERVFVAPFDPDRLEFTGVPEAVLPRAWVDQNLMQIDVSTNGTVAYLPSSLNEGQELVTVDLDGRMETLFSERLPFRSINDPRISRDGRKLLVSVEGGDIYMIDLDTQTPTLMGEAGFYPLWSPDGDEVVYGSTAGETFDILRRPIDLSRPAQVYLDEETNLRTADWTAQGALIIRDEIPDKGMDLKYVPDMDEPTLLPLLEGDDDELAPVVSADGKWLAFVSNYSGTDEIYVTAFPEPGGRRQISMKGGTSPVWAPDGSVLYYFEGQQLIAVAIEIEPRFRVTGRRELFEGDFVQYRWSRQYDIHPDGDRFILVKNPARGNIEVVTNWFAELGTLDD